LPPRAIQTFDAEASVKKPDDGLLVAVLQPALRDQLTKSAQRLVLPNAMIAAATASAIAPIAKIRVNEAVAPYSSAIA
jgi:hypothetical protein